MAGFGEGGRGGASGARLGAAAPLFLAALGVTAQATEGSGSFDLQGTRGDFDAGPVVQSGIHARWDFALHEASVGVRPLGDRVMSAVVIPVSLDLNAGGTATVDSMCDGGWAWATNAPCRHAKLVASRFGGTRDLMLVSWPARIRPDRTPFRFNGSIRRITMDLHRDGVFRMGQ